MDAKQRANKARFKEELKKFYILTVEGMECLCCEAEDVTCIVTQDGVTICEPCATMSFDIMRGDDELQQQLHDIEVDLESYEMNGMWVKEKSNEPKKPN